MGGNAHFEGQTAIQTETSEVGGDCTAKASVFIQSGLIYGAALCDVRRTHQTQTGDIRNGLQTTGRKAESVVLDGKNKGDVSLHTSQFSLGKTAEVDSNGFLLRADSSGFAGRLRTRYLGLESPVTYIHPSGNLFIGEHGNLKALTSFLNLGWVYGAITLNTEFGDINDLGNLSAAGWLTLQARSHPNTQEILDGKHPSFVQSGGLHLIEPGPIKLYSISGTPCNIGITAPYINLFGPVSMTKDLMLETTVGSLHLRFPISVRSLFLTSAGDLSTSNVRFQNQLIFNAKGSYENAQQPFAHDRFMGRDRFGFHRRRFGFQRPGTIIGPNGVAQITAASILNPNLMSLMDTNVLSLRATQGNIVNYGTFRGRTYLEKKAHGDIIDHATLSYTRVGKKMIPFYIPAQNIGGTGIDYTDATGQKRKLGLKAEAGGQILNYASGYQAIGDIFLQGTKGVSHVASSQEYLESTHTKKSGLFKHKKKTTETWNTSVCNPSIVSHQGRVVYHIPEGGLNLIGCHVYGREGDFAIVRDPIRYGDLVGQTRVQTKKSSWWGASKSSRSETHEFPIITQIVNGSLVYHQSLLGGISGTGVSIQAPLYYGKAKGKITFDGIQLHHSVRQKSSSVFPSFFGSDAIFKGESIGSTVVRSDPLGSSIAKLRGAQGSANKFSQGVKTGVQTWQDITTFSNAYSQGTLPQALLERVGNVGISGTHSTFTRRYSTTAPSIFNVGGLILESDEGVVLLGGTQAHIEKLFKVRAPHLTLEKATNESHMKTHSTSWKVGWNVATRMPYANASYHSSKSDATTHQNALIHVYGSDGIVDFGDLPTLNLNGGVIKAPHFQGRVGTMNMRTFQDEFRNSQQGFSVSGSGWSDQKMSGSFSISQGKSHEKRVNQHPGLIATNGFDEDFTIGKLKVVDTDLDPALVRQAKSTTFTKLYDVSKSYHVSIGLSNIDLTSTQGFVESFGKSAVVMGTSFAVAEATRELGGNDLATSMAGTFAGLGTSSFINQSMSEGTPPEASSLESPQTSFSGLGQLGELSYSRKGKNTQIFAMDLNIQQLGNGLKVIESAAEKLDEALSQVRIVAPEDVQSQVDVLEQANKIMDKAGVSEREKVELLIKVSPVLIEAAIEDEKSQGKRVTKRVSVKTKDKKPVVEVALQVESKVSPAKESALSLEPEKRYIHIEPREKLRKAQRCLDELEIALGERQKETAQEVRPAQTSALGASLKTCLQGSSVGLSRQPFKDHLTYYPLNSDQERDIETVFTVFSRLGRDENASQQFSDKYRDLGYQPLYGFFKGDDTMRLHLLSRIDESNSDKRNHPTSILSIGAMPLIPARDLSVIGLPSRTLGHVEAFGRGPVGYLEGQITYINPASHQYVSMEGLAIELAALGVTRGIGGIGRAVRPPASSLKPILFDYSVPEAAFSLPINPVTRKGPMSIDSILFTSGEKTLYGGIRNAKQFWEMWIDKYPETLSIKNQERISVNKVPLTDSHWVSHFPEHQSYLGKKLEHHHLDQGSLAVPLPDELHRLNGNYPTWHK